VEAAQAGLSATLIVRHDSGKLFVNFDAEILQLIRETKCLMQIQLEVPEGAKMMLMQDEKFKQYYNHIAYTLKEFEKITTRINPVLKPVLEEHITSLTQVIQPGLSTLTWASMNIDAYLGQTNHGITRLGELLNKVNDLIENRIEGCLKIVSKTPLVDLPEDKFPFNVSDFVNMQEQFIKDQSSGMDCKNLEIERSVYDLLELVDKSPL